MALNIAAYKSSVRIEEAIGARIPLRRVSSHWVGPCPFHDDSTPSLTVFPRTQTWKCFGCGRYGDVVDFVSTFDHKPVADLLRTTTKEPPPHVEDPSPPASPVRAGLIERHETYRRLLDALPLTTRHREILHAKGLDDTLIATLEARSFSPGPSPIDPETLGIPGFFFVGTTWHLQGSSGILLPVKDSQGLIQGCQVRIDDAQQGRYRWLSSPLRPGGASSGAPMAVVPGPGSTVWITEGVLKAHIASRRLGVPVIGLPGFSLWRQPLLADTLQKYRAKRVVIAFDQDPKPALRRSVQDQARQLGAMLSHLGMSWAVAHWRGPKGIDDALRAGCPIRVHPSDSLGLRVSS